MGSVSFSPSGRLQPVFFMHIPKTSGSSINNILRQIYGDDNFVQHIETLNRRANKKSLVIAREVDCVTGHVYLGSWRQFGGADHYALATILRDPWSRLISHINWMDRFNYGSDSKALRRLHPFARRVVRILSHTDFQDRRSIISMRNRLSKDGRWHLFDNLQTRMFARKSIRDALTKQSVNDAIHAMSEFAALGICEDQAAFTDGLRKLANATTDVQQVHTNTAPASSRLSISNDIARGVLEQWVEHDTLLYEWVAQHNRLRRLQSDTPAQREPAIG